MAYTREQQRNIRLALQLTRNDPPVVRRSLIMAMLVESNARHIRYGDRDSLGVLQQRPSQGWGPYQPGLAGARRDMLQYLSRARKLARGWSGSAGQLAQAVQRSAYPGRYDDRSPEVRKILKQFGGGGGPGGSMTFQLPGIQGKQAAQPTGLTMRDAALSGLQALASGNYDPLEGLEQLAQVAEEASATPGIPGGQLTTPGARQRQQKGPVNIRRWLVVPKPAGSGPLPKRYVQSFAAQMAATYGRRLVAFDNSRHSKYTVNGRVSAHHSGDAIDIAARGAKLRQLGYIALVQAGMSPREARKAARKGGLYNVGGWQIIFATQIGGDHSDHVHIGHRR